MTKYFYEVYDSEHNKLDIKQVDHYNSYDDVVNVQIILNDDFDILTASIDTICDRLDVIGDYNKGILFLSDYHNIDLLSHKLNLPYYPCPIWKNVIYDCVFERDDGMFLNMDRLKKLVRKIRRKEL